MKFLIPGGIPRAALITGGGRQPGIVKALADAGFAIALQHHPDVSDDLPGGAVLLPADLSAETETASLLTRATLALGPIGVLVNAASVLQHDTWDEADRATWDMHIETNLRAPFVLIQSFAKALPASHEGAVINLLDQRTSPHLVSYALSKAALWTLTQTMALALAPRIRVNGIVPWGVTRGTGLRTAPDEAPLGSGRAHSDEVGRATLAILALSSMTGQMIVPDGVPPSAA
jgi:NAD(P)-dependent dehydrogenase (short-subunit alcohol dehydrogenase family)